MTRSFLRQIGPPVMLLIAAAAIIFCAVAAAGCDKNVALVENGDPSGDHAFRFYGYMGMGWDSQTLFGVEPLADPGKYLTLTATHVAP